MTRPHIIILGAGFGGVYIAKKLAAAVKKGEIDLTIVNRTNSFLFTPLLHEVATGGLSPQTVAEPLREIFVGTKIRIIEGVVRSINSTNRTLFIQGGSNSVILKFDYLVIATGAETNYYGIPGAAENTLPLKSLRDAAIIRNRVISALEQAVTMEDPAHRRELLSFVVIGGGATGVELAAELSEFLAGMLDRYYGKVHCRTDDPRHCRPDEPSITLIHAGKELLEQFAPSLRRSAHKHLTKMGVKVKVSSTVTSVGDNSISLTPTEIVNASTMIWSAGVRAVVPKFEDISPTLSGGRIAVDNYFRILGSDRIFAMGDVSAYVDSHDSSKIKLLPQLAQVAQREAEIVAVNLLSSVRKQPMSDFHYHSKGSMVSVGQWFAIGEIFSMNIAGKLTWWMWRTVYLFKFASGKKRLRIAIEWFLQMFFPRDITKIS